MISYQINDITFVTQTPSFFHLGSFKVRSPRRKTRIGRETSTLRVHRGGTNESLAGKSNCLTNMLETPL